jgi:hypothetical protein
MTLGDSLVKDMLDITVADHKPLQDKWQHRVGWGAEESTEQGLSEMQWRHQCWAHSPTQPLLDNPSSSSVENLASPHSSLSSFNNSNLSHSTGSSCFSSFSVQKPLSTQWKISPEQYWVKETRVSWVPTGMLEWVRVADGIRMHDPGGNSMAMCRSHKMRWPPCLGS